MRAITILLLLLTSCGPVVKKEASGVMREAAKVEILVFTPGFHKSDVNVGIDFNGNLSVVPTSVTVPDKYGVVFTCQHGKFFVQRRELYERLTQGQEVVVTYRELYKATYNRESGLLEKRELYDYDFLDVEAR